MNNSQSVYLSSLEPMISGFSPFTVKIYPNGISSTSKIYKITYDFGDGNVFDDLLTPDSNPVLKTTTHTYYLTGNLKQEYSVKTYVYYFAGSYDLYEFSLNLNTPTLEGINTLAQTLCSNYFDEVHLVGSRMVGPDNDVLYIFESINPKYIIPVCVNWKSRPIEKILTIPKEHYRPFKLLAPFENELITSINTGTNIISVGYDDVPVNPDNGSPDVQVYGANPIAATFLGTVNGDWFNLLNWKTIDNSGVKNLPNEYITVHIYAPVNIDSGNIAEADVAHFYENSLLSYVSLMVSSSAVFHSNSYNFGNIIGDAYFMDNSYNFGIEPTLLLLKGEGADGSTDILDSSTNNRILSSTGNVYITSIPVTPNVEVSDGLTFKIDASTYAYDNTIVDSVSGAIGTLIGSPEYISQSPANFNFNGNSQYISFAPYNSAVNVTNNFTLEAWINIKDNYNYRNIISLSKTGWSNRQYSLSLNYGRFNFTNGYYSTYFSNCTLNKWTHIVMTFENGICKFYQDGVLTDTTNFGPTNLTTIPDAYLTIGFYPFGYYEYFYGNISICKIYNKVLSSYEVIQNYNLDSERFGNINFKTGFINFNINSSIFPISGGNDFEFKKGDFTIEGWINQTQQNGYTAQSIYDTRNSNYNIGFPFLYINGYYNNIVYNNGYYDMIYGDTLKINTWNHIAVSKKNNTIKLFINGVQSGGDAYDNVDYKSSFNKPILGNSFNKNQPFIGYMKDLKVTKGFSKYETNFTPSSSLNVDPYLTGTVSNSAFFNNESTNYGTLINATFSGNSQNVGIVENAAVYYPVTYPLGGSYTNINYYGYIFGCNDPDADNYNPSANTSDGSCTYSSIDLNNGVLAYWKFDESSGTRVDSTSNGNDLYENGSINSITGKINDSALFSTNWYNYLYNNDFSIPASSDFTICGWVYLNEGGFQEIISQWYYGYVGNFIITYGESDSDEFWFRVRTNNGQSSPIKIQASLNAWNFVAMRWKDGIELQASINNQQWYSMKNNGNLQPKNWTKFMIGAGEIYGYYPVNGAIDEVGIWGRKLNAGEISSLYNSGVGKTYPF